MKFSNNSTIKITLILSFALITISLALSLCQSFMIDNNLMNLQKPECCGSGINSNLLSFNHIDYFQSATNAVVHKIYQGFFVLFAALFIIGSIFKYLNNLFLLKFNLLNTFPHMSLWNFLHLAYARGIVQSKHLD